MIYNISILKLLMDGRINGYEAIDLVQVVVSDNNRYSWNDGQYQYSGTAKTAVIGGEEVIQITVQKAADNVQEEEVYLSGIAKEMIPTIKELTEQYLIGCIGLRTWTNRMFDICR